jgi:hypothetical protein
MNGSTVALACCVEGHPWNTSNYFSTDNRHPGLVMDCTIGLGTELAHAIFKHKWQHLNSAREPEGARYT